MILKFAACAAALALAVLPAAAQTAFTAKDMAMLDRASDPHVSPDARYIAFNQRSTDWDGNKGVNALMIADRQSGAAPRKLISDEKGATAPRWSADGTLYFLSSRSGTTQVWRTTADAAGMAQVTSLPMDVGFYRISADGRTLIVTQDVYPDCATLACSKDKADAKAKEKTSGTLYDGQLPRFWDAFEDERFVNLFAVDLKTPGAPALATPLMQGYRVDLPEKPTGSASAFELTPDGKQVIFSARPSGSSQGMGDAFALYIAPADGSAAPRRLDPASKTSESNPIVSPDGQSLVWLSRPAQTFEPPYGKLMLRPLAGGAARQITVKADLALEDIAWAKDGKSIYALAEDTGQRRIFRIDPASGAVTPLTMDGHVGEMDASSSVLAYTRDALDSPPQVWELAAGGSPKQVSTIGGAALKSSFASFEQFSFTGWNNEKVHGYVVKPHGFQPGNKYPIAFLIHGGPYGNFANAWSFRWNPQVWSSMGYAVVMVDFHGSSSYGEKFARSILGHWGDRPLEDLQKGWAYALKTYAWLDGDKACALGGSYGGYMVSWIAGAWNKPWKCLVNHDGVFDARSMAYSTDIPTFAIAGNGADTWADLKQVEQFSPASRVKDWAKPMLVVHGGKDYRVPLDQGIAAYTAARQRGIPAQFLYFPDENHWVLKPQNSVQWYATVEAWMARWLKDGGAASPPAR
jgi:acylaminoacyl-peptidase